MYLCPELCPGLWRNYLVVLGLVLCTTFLFWPVSASALERQRRPHLDDADRASLVQALGESISYLGSRPKGTCYLVGERRISAELLLSTALHLQQLAQREPDAATFARRLEQDFVWGVIAGDTPQKLLVTGYYQPIFPARLSPSSSYSYPLYRKPADLVQRTDAEGQVASGRLVNDRLHPYWTRQEIERELPLQGQELVWLRDPFDVFTLHVQGSGIVQLEDGRRLGVHYAAKNGHPYTSIGRYLVQTGRMELAQVNMESLRGYLASHPQEAEQILQQNASYIFFEWQEPGPAVGSLNRGLTPGRSVAADQRIYPPGAVLWLQTQRPVVKGETTRWQPLHRLVTVQDSGSAIQGPGRLDLFWGTGEQAGREAGQMRAQGQVRLLLLKGLGPDPAGR